jgi:cysteine desulfurase
MLLSIGAHKLYGPKGVGALYVRRGTTLLPAQTGGKQENALRAGTQNIPYIVGLAEALALAQQERGSRVENVIPLRDRLIGTVLEEIPRSRLTGHPSQRLLQMLDVAGFACSSGSACKTGNPQPSEVLTAIGLSRSWSMGSLRVTLGLTTTPDEVERFLHTLPELVRRVRALGA